MAVNTADSKTDLRAVLIKQGVSATPWFAILDAACDASAPQRAKDAGLQVKCLYAGREGAALGDAAPHLCTFDFENEFAEWWLQSWGGNRGLLLQSSVTMEDLRRHLRKFLLVKNEAGKKLRFRFYDPRILCAFLPVCTAAELSQFFGPVVRYFAERRSGTSLAVFGWGSQGLTVQEHDVTKPESQGSKHPAHTPQRYGVLEVVVVDQVGTRTLENASVQISGPEMRTAVSGPGGRVLFERVAPGGYEVYAIDPTYRMGRKKVVVSAARKKLLLKCRPTAAAKT